MSMLDDLYETIGGSETIDAAIASFYRRVLDDDKLRPFFHSTDMTRLRAGQSMFVSMLVGGRRVYNGKNIHAAHAQARAQGLTAEHLDAFLHHFRDAICEAGVGPDKADKIMQLLESHRSAVLNH